MVTLTFAARIAGSLGVAIALTGAAAAQSIVATTPNLQPVDGPVSATLNGTTIVNQGLQGVGRLPATTRDFLGDTLGSFSSLAIDLTTWRRSGDTYTGTLFTLPDRGYNNPDGGLFTDYAGRLNRFNLSFTPEPAANLPQSTASQRQITLTPNGGIVLTDANGQRFSGLDPGAGTTTQFGTVLPSAATGPSAGRISLDAEGLARRLDGTFYVSDEYGANIYYFNANGQLRGVLGVPDALRPRTGGQLNFNSLAAPDTGRRNNQGFEALSLTPDGRSLVTILQSAALQDSTTNQQTRLNTRILVYDIANTPVPTAPVREYVLQLPVYRDNGNGQAANRTAAQSEMIALNDTQFLVLSRDSNGLGPGTTTPIVYKSILLVDIAQATNIAGSVFDTTTTPISPGGALRTDIRPVQTTEVVNLLNPVQLGRFGMNLNTNPATQTTLSEKFEALGLVPVLSEKAPRDYYLLVGNDNDFLTRQGSINGQSYDAGINNDSVLLAYRLTLPTYVDPLSLAVMKQTAPTVLQGLGAATLGFASSSTRGVQDHLSALRRGAGTASPWNEGAGLWVGGDFIFADQQRSGGLAMDRTIAQGTVGLDLPFTGPWRAGVAVGGGGGSLSRPGGFRQEQSAYTFSAYGGYYGPDFYLQGIAGGAPDVALDRISRPGAYGLTAAGRTDGSAVALDAEIGVPFQMDSVRLTPFAGITHLAGRVDGFTETGAAGNNVAYQSLSIRQTTSRFGAEAAFYGFGALIPSVRVAYNLASGPQGTTAGVRLASVENSLASAAVTVPFLRDDFVSAGAGVQGAISERLGWRVDYQAAIGLRAGTAHGVTAGLRYQW